MEDDQLGLRRDTSNRTACTLAKVVKQFADTRNRQNCTLAKSVKKSHGNAQVAEEVADVGECDQFDGQSKLFTLFT